jgi:hypothetical protein
MISKKVTVEGFDGNEDRVYWFHLTKSEVVKWDAEFNGELKEFLAKTAESQSVPEVYAAITELLRRAVGERRGNKFVKDADVTSDFEFSGAMDEVIEWMFSTPDAIEEFLLGILPKDVVEKAKTSASE